MDCISREDDFMFGMDGFYSFIGDGVEFNGGDFFVFIDDEVCDFVFDKEV